jgi:anthranilate synthase component 1
LSEKNGAATWIGTAPAGAPSGIDPLKALDISATHLRSPKLPGLPPLTGGLVGFLSYEIVRRLEKLPNQKPDDVGVPELAFILTSDLAVYDHKEASVTLIANAINWDGSSERVDWAYEDALKRLAKMSDDLMKSSPASKSPQSLSEQFLRNSLSKKWNKLKMKLSEAKRFKLFSRKDFRPNVG